MLENVPCRDRSANVFDEKMAHSTTCVITIVCALQVFCWLPGFAQAPSSSQAANDPFLTLMTRAAAHAKQHGDRFVPALSPAYETLLGPAGPVNVKDLQAAGFAVVPWTVDDLQTMRVLLEQQVNGIISDRPDLLAVALQEAREKAVGNAAQLAYLDGIDAEGHRGGRGLRPENTLPAFEVGLDNGINSIETDTGVTTDHQSLIWHDQFLNPQSCRRSDGQAYAIEDRVYIHDISMIDAQRQFICDKLHFGPEQKNDLALSPVSIAFAAEEKMISPYAPTYVAQLFRFADFYARWYRSGPGKSTPNAAARARTAERVHFNLETKILPEGYSEAKTMAVGLGKTEAELKSSGKLPASAFTPSRTVSPEVFVETLCGAVQAYHMEDRADVQSFDFRTLLLVQERYPKIRTFYLTSSPAMLSTDFLPESLRTSIPVDQKP
jgi:glycerophosphoryl diester phosphodiesterase